jgi:hypothetical protein
LPCSKLRPMRWVTMAQLGHPKHARDTNEPSAAK